MNNSPHLRNIVSESLSLTFANRLRLAQSLLVPFSLLMLLDYIKQLESTGIPNILISSLSLIIYTVFTITVHRVILLGEKSVSKWGIYKWSKRETYFFIHFFALLILFILFFIASMFILREAGVLVGVLFSAYMFSRYSLLFPATAIDKGLTLKSSWALSKNHKLLMIYIVVLIPAVFALPMYLISQITDAFWVASIINSIATVYTISFLSIAYSEICKLEYSN